MVTTRDREPLVRSASLQALGEIGRRPTPHFAEIIEVMIAVLADREREEAVVRQSALDGLATLASKVTAERQEVIRVLASATSDRNPRLARKAEDILNRLGQIGFCGTVAVGEPNQPALQIPVSNGYAGMVILAGLNPLAAVEETGIDTQNMSLSIMMDYQKLSPIT